MKFQGFYGGSFRMDLPWGHRMWLVVVNPSGTNNYAITLNLMDRSRNYLLGSLFIQTVLILYSLWQKVKFRPKVLCLMTSSVWGGFGGHPHPFRTGANFTRKTKEEKDEKKKRCRRRFFRQSHHERITTGKIRVKTRGISKKTQPDRKFIEYFASSRWITT